MHNENLNPQADAEVPAIYHFGQALAILEAATPGGISPTTFNLAVAQPLVYLGQLRQKAQPTPEQEEMLAELLAKVPDLPERVKLEDQGPIWLGYYHLVGRLLANGRPKG